MAEGPHTDQNGSGKGAKPLERYFQILEMVAAFPEELTLAELAASLGLPKTTIYRLVTGLLDSELVIHGRADGLRLAPRLLNLIHAGSDGSEVELLARTCLRDLARQTGLTAYIAKLQGTMARTVATETPNANFSLHVNPGSHMVWHATASAKAILAFQSPDFIRLCLAEPLPKLTPTTKTDLAEVLKELEEVRATGLATCYAEDHEGFGALAAPIRIPDIGIKYSVGLCGPLELVKRNMTDASKDILQQGAEKLSALILTSTNVVAQRRKRTVPAGEAEA